MQFRLQRPPRFAFTLVELLVVIGIMGVLVAISLPAVQQTREAARQMSCKNNLKQIGLALQSYHDVHRRLPMGCFEWRSYFSSPGNRNFAWSAAILPYMEQVSVYEKVDFRYGYDHPVNSAAARVEIPTYLCPSVAPAIGSNFGTSHFGGLHGERLVNRPSGDGVLLHDRHIRFRDCFDGLSQIIAVSEDVVGPHGEWINGYNVFVQAHGINDARAWKYDNEIRSRHPGGAPVLLLDGSVQFLTESTDHFLLGSLITRGNREVIPSNAF